MSATIKLSSPATKEFWEILVLHEDDRILALCKPPRLLTSPDRYDRARPDLMRLLHEGIHLGKPWAKERGLAYLANVHRLEFETSGVLLLAKDKPALVNLANQFGAEQPQMTYIALVEGIPAEDTFEVNARIGPHPTRRGVMCVSGKIGKRSITRFEVMQRFRGWSLLRCLPRTSRTHQIRVHLKHAGYSILGDRVYGGGYLQLSQIKQEYRLKPGRTERPLISSVALHAEQLVVRHPGAGAPVHITAPWPKDLEVALKFLRRYVAIGGPAPSTEQDLPPE